MAEPAAAAAEVKILLDDDGRGAETEMVEIPVGDDNPAHIFPTEEEKREVDRKRESLLQPVCQGAAPFCGWIWLCCCCGLVAPITLMVLWGSIYVLLPLLIAAIVLFVLGCCLCCYGIRPLLTKDPPAPPRQFPLDSEPTYQVPRRVAVLVNPMGGQHGAQGLFDDILKPELEKAGIEVKKIETQYAGHGKVLCNTMSFDDIDAIVAIGGDGTFHECVNGMLERVDGKSCPIGLIPGGSGNSILTDFGLNLNALEAAKNVAAGRVGLVDATLVEFGPDSSTNPHQRVWSINVVGFCADHCMAAVNIDSWRPLLGTARYDICGLWGLLKGRTAKGELIADGSVMSNEIGAVFANTTQYFGKGSRAAPLAKMDDGLIDIGNVRGSRGHGVKIFALIPKGSHNEIMEHCQAKELEFRLPKEEEVFNVDGEVFVTLHNKIHLTVHPKKLQMYVPKKEDWERHYVEK